MRYYSIEIDGGPTYTSLLNGVTNPAALQVMLDIPVAPFASPASAGAFVKIFGVPLSDIGQQQNLIHKGIKIYGGFQAGLPLANPAQAGLLVQGYIFQAFGNWIGINQSLDLVIVAGPPPADTNNPRKPPNLVLNWKQGTAMSAAIQQTLSTAFSGYSVNTNINPNLKLLEDEAAYFHSIDEFARYVKGTSREIIGTTTYPGVSITVDGTTFKVFDNTPPTSTSLTQQTTVSPLSQPKASTNSKSIAFQDLIGQPTWIEAPYIQWHCPMRADLKVGDQVTLPQTLVTNSAQAQSSLINQFVAQQGTFQISSVRHVGDFRQANAEAWVTVFDAFPLQLESNPVSS